MPVNSDKPHLWKADTLESIDFYNEWFLRFAPATYRQQRKIKAKEVANALELTDNLRSLTADLLKKNPGILSMLRMTAAPPLARDRLIGLAYTTKNLVFSMEGSEDKPSRIPPRMQENELDVHLARIVDVLSEMADRDLFPWLEDNSVKSTEENLLRSASVVADRLCGNASDPIIRNAQERRQLGSIGRFLQAHGYREILPSDVDGLLAMPSGTYAFRHNVTVGSDSSSINIPIDCVISRHNRQPDEFPLLIEAKSAGDTTNTNKRRKEEAQKFTQLKQKFGDDIHFVLFLCGYFEAGYLGYEASEGIDWIWEHRINDFLYYIGDANPSDTTSQIVQETGLSYSDSFLKIEAERFRLQKAVDSLKTSLQRNKLGQFSTPFSLAKEIVSYTVPLCEGEKDLTMLEPACGSGVFISAAIAGNNENVSYEGIEIDSAYAVICEDLFGDYNVEVRNKDFFDLIDPLKISRQYELIITNPPYVRHHHIETFQKQRLQSLVSASLNLQVSGLSGLYIYYILLSHTFLKEGGVASWLIPSEFLYTNYGKVLRQYFTNKVTLLRIHRFEADDVQFDDALVSSCVVTYRKSAKPASHEFDVTTGSYQKPTSSKRINSKTVSPHDKWNFLDPSISTVHEGIRLDDLFHITRGLATGNNDFFVLNPDMVTESGIESQFLVPLLPSPRDITSPIIRADSEGRPLLDKRRYLLSITSYPDELRSKFPGVEKYLKDGVERGVPEGYLCRSRKVWYFQEKRDPALFLATYMGRNGNGNKSPIRFFLNRSKGLATNVFICLYPRPNLLRLLKVDSTREEELLEALNGISEISIERAGRSYGGGLKKVEPKELRSIHLTNPPAWLSLDKQDQLCLFNKVS